MDTRNMRTITEGKREKPTRPPVQAKIRRWAEEHGAKPARVKGSERDAGVGALRLDFPGYSGDEQLERITWEEWFERFEEQNLTLLHDEITTRGRLSRLNELMSGATPAAIRSTKSLGKKTSRAAVDRPTGKASSRNTKLRAAKKAA
jgi:hypothetical protein